MNGTKGMTDMKIARFLVLAALAPILQARAGSVSWGEFREEVEARDPGLLSQAAQLRQAEAARDQARGALLPSVGLTAQYTRVSDVGDGSVTLPFPQNPVSIALSPWIPDQWVVAARVEQVLWDGRNLSQWRASRHEGEAARAGLARARRDLRLRALQAWCDLWASSREVAAADSARAAFAEQARVLSAGVREGTALANDSLRSRLLLRQSEVSLLSARLRLEGARDRAANLLGRPLGGIDVTDSVPEVEVPAAAADPSEVVQARERALSAGWLEKAQESAFLPVVSAGAQIEDMDPNPRVVPARDAARSDWKVWVAAQWNVFRGGADWYGSRRAAAAREEAGLRLQAVQESQALQVSDARRAFALSEERLSAARDVVRLAREDRVLLQLRAEAGTALRADLLDRIGQEWKAESERARAEASRTLAAAALRVAMGADLP